MCVCVCVCVCVCACAYDIRISVSLLKLFQTSPDMLDSSTIIYSTTLYISLSLCMYYVKLTDSVFPWKSTMVV